MGTVQNSPDSLAQSDTGSLDTITEITVKKSAKKVFVSFDLVRPTEGDHDWQQMRPQTGWLAGFDMENLADVGSNPRPDIFSGMAKRFAPM